MSMLDNILLRTVTLLDRSGGAQVPSSGLRVSGARVSAGAIDFGHFNALEFGATGDGVADDTDGLRAVDLAAHAAGAHLYFPPGTYRISSSYTFVSPCEFAPRGRAQLLLDSSDPTKYFAVYPAVILSANRSVEVDWFAANYGSLNPDLVVLRNAIAAAPNGCTVLLAPRVYDLTTYNADSDAPPAGNMGLIDLWGKKHLTILGQRGTILSAGGVDTMLFWARGTYHLTIDSIKVVGDFDTRSNTTNNAGFLITDNQNIVETGLIDGTSTIAYDQVSKVQWFVPYSSNTSIAGGLLPDTDYDIFVWITKATGAATGSDAVLSVAKSPAGFTVHTSVAPGVQNVINYQIGLKSETRDLTIKNCEISNYNGGLCRLGPSTRDVDISRCLVDSSYQGIETVGTTYAGATAPIGRARSTSNVKIHDNTFIAAVRSGRTDLFPAGAAGIISGTDDMLDLWGTVWDYDVYNNLFECPSGGIHQHTHVGDAISTGDISGSVTDLRRLKVRGNTFRGFGGDGSYLPGGNEAPGGAMLVFFWINGTVQGLEITDNTVENCNNGFWIQGNATQNYGSLKIAGNKISKCRRGITVINGAWPGTRIERNQVVDCQVPYNNPYAHAIRVSQSDDCVVRNNEIVSTVPGALVTAFFCGPSSRGVFSDNRVVGAHSSHSAAFYVPGLVDGHFLNNHAIALPNTVHGVQFTSGTVRTRHSQGTVIAANQSTYVASPPVLTDSGCSIYSEGIWGGGIGTRPKSCGGAFAQTSGSNQVTVILPQAELDDAYRVQITPYVVSSTVAGSWRVKTLAAQSLDRFTVIFEAAPDHADQFAYLIYRGDS